MSIALIAVTDAGRTAAQHIASSWPDTRTYDIAELQQAWRDCDGLLLFLALGATVRLIAPLLSDKHSDPGVVCIDEARRFAVAVVGGHAAAANALAERAADALGATPVVTTATDATQISPLDLLGWPVEGDIAAVSRALLDGRHVTLTADATWPLPPLPVEPAARPQPPCVIVTDRIVALPPATVIVRPPSLVVGVGASRGVTADEVAALITDALRDADLAAASIVALSTVTAKADEPGLVGTARKLGVPLVTHPAQALAEIRVPNPSEHALRAVGTPSVAEAAALADANDLVVTKRKSAQATVAIARRRPRGRLILVGIGPGARDLLTPRAIAELRRCSHIVGLDQYVTQIADLLRPGTRVHASNLGAEEERAGTAVALARGGHAVALIGSGDAGIYALASPALEAADDTFDVVGVPGVTAMLAAAAVLGAPLGHDHCAISLSDLHTPWEAIERRIRAAATADLVVAFYNPRSRARDWQLGRALAILAEHRPDGTPVGIVNQASRPGEHAVLSTLTDVDMESVGMTSIVIVGSTRSQVVAGRFVTPREYRWQN